MASYHGPAGWQQTGDAISPRPKLNPPGISGKLTFFDKLGELQDATNLDVAYWITAHPVLGDAFVVTGQGGIIATVDCSDPASPTLVASETGIGTISGHTTYGTHVVFRESDNQNFETRDLERYDQIGAGGSVSLVSGNGPPLVVGEYGLVPATAEIHTVDLSDPANPSVTGTTSIGNSLNGHLWEKSRTGRIALLPSSTNGRFATIDITDPTSPSVMDWIDSGFGELHTSEPNGTFPIAVSRDDDALVLFNAQDPTSLSVAGSVTDANRLDGPHDVKVRGSVAFVTCKGEDTAQASITRVDISDPTAPSIIEEHPVPGGDDVTHTHLAGDYAIVASADDNEVITMSINGLSVPQMHVGGLHAHELEAEHLMATQYLGDSMAVKQATAEAMAAELIGGGTGTIDEIVNNTKYTDPAGIEYTGRIGDLFDLFFASFQSASGGGSVTLSTGTLQLREPGDAAAVEESRAFSHAIAFDPSQAGSITIHVSNIAIDDNTDARILLQISTRPDGDGQLSSGDAMTGQVRGSGRIDAITRTDGSAGLSSDTNQNNAYVSGLNTIKISWDGSELTLETDDGTTTVTVTDSNQYPSGSNLFLKISAWDNDGANARNVDFDVTDIDFQD